MYSRPPEGSRGARWRRRPRMRFRNRRRSRRGHDAHRRSGPRRRRRVARRRRRRGTARRRIGRARGTLRRDRRGGGPARRRRRKARRRLVRLRGGPADEPRGGLALRQEGGDVQGARRGARPRGVPGVQSSGHGGVAPVQGLRRARRLAAGVAQGLLRAAAAGEEAAEPHRGRRVRARPHAPAGRVPGQARAPPRVPQRRGAARLPHRAGPRARPRVARLCRARGRLAAKRRGPAPGSRDARARKLRGRLRGHELLDARHRGGRRVRRGAGSRALRRVREPERVRGGGEVAAQARRRQVLQPAGRRRGD